MVVHFNHNAAPRASTIGTPLSPFLALWNNRQLAGRLLRRDLAIRYRGSVLGASWSLLSPLLVLATYEIGLSRLLMVRWEGVDSHTSTLMVFAGLIVFNIFAECLSRAPSLIVDNVNYVKKVVFPLEILPWVCVLSSLVSAAVAVALLLFFEVALTGGLPWTAVLAPLALLPHALVMMGVVWVLASVSVFLRDMRQLVGPLVTAAMFATPIFFPLTAIPGTLRSVLQLNPMSSTIEQLRAIMLQGIVPPPLPWLTLLALGLLCNWIGWLWFDKTKRGFADVL